jgi:hypothetical protein
MRMFAIIFCAVAALAVGCSSKKKCENGQCEMKDHKAHAHHHGKHGHGDHEHGKGQECGSDCKGGHGHGGGCDSGKCEHHSGTAAAAPVSVTFKCTAKGSRSIANNDYKSIYAGDITLNPATLPVEPDTAVGVCKPYKNEGAVVGGKSSLPVRVSAERCGSHGLYYLMSVNYKDTWMDVDIRNGSGRVVLSPEPGKSKRVRLKEGNFEEVYVECKMQ